MELFCALSNLLQEFSRRELRDGQAVGEQALRSKVSRLKFLQPSRLLVNREDAKNPLMTNHQAMKPSYEVPITHGLARARFRVDFLVNREDAKNSLITNHQAIKPSYEVPSPTAWPSPRFSFRKILFCNIELKAQQIFF